MAVVPRTRPITAEEYFALDLPERRTQLVNGEIVVNEPSARHQRIAGEVYALIRQWCRAEPARGEAFLPLDVHLGRHDVYAPDVLWVSEARRPRREALRLDAPPDLAVEVRSPSTWRHDLHVKKGVYESTGLPELWLVDTAADTVLVFRRSAPGGPAFDAGSELGRGKQLTTPLLPGLAIDLDELFDR